MDLIVTEDESTCNFTRNHGKPIHLSHWSWSTVKCSCAISLIDHIVFTVLLFLLSRLKTIYFDFKCATIWSKVLLKRVVIIWLQTLYHQCRWKLDSFGDSASVCALPENHSVKHCYNGKAYSLIYTQEHENKRTPSYTRRNEQMKEYKRKREKWVSLKLKFHQICQLMCIVL